MRKRERGRKSEKEREINRVVKRKKERKRGIEKQASSMFQMAIPKISWYGVPK